MWHNGTIMLPKIKPESITTRDVVKAYALEMGFDLVGITSAKPFTETEEIALQRVRDGLMDGLPWYHEARVIRGCRPQEI
jgi:epoxyqueuosine reductase QueG